MSWFKVRRRRWTCCMATPKSASKEPKLSRIPPSKRIWNRRRKAWWDSWRRSRRQFRSWMRARLISGALRRHWRSKWWINQQQRFMTMCRIRSLRCRFPLTNPYGFSNLPISRSKSWTKGINYSAMSLMLKRFKMMIQILQFWRFQNSSRKDWEAIS